MSTAAELHHIVAPDPLAVGVDDQHMVAGVDDDVCETRKRTTSLDAPNSKRRQLADTSADTITRDGVAASHQHSTFAEPSTTANTACAKQHSNSTRTVCRLSFEDELTSETDAAHAGVDPNTTFAVGASASHRFALERTALHSNSEADPPATSSPAPRTTLGPVTFGVAAARGARPYMEDRHCCVSFFQPVDSSGEAVDDGVARSFAAVFDGHNGVRAAEHATSRLQQLLAAEPALRLCTGDGPPANDSLEEEQVGSAFRRAFSTVDAEILQVAKEEETRDGATALVVLRTGSVLYAAHAGDSRAVMCRNQEAYRLTEDHKPDLPRERTRVEQLGGRVEFQRCWRIISEPRRDRPLSGLAVSRSFGDLDFKEPKKYVSSEPDVHRVRLQPSDRFVLLASDGLWDVCSDQEAVDLVGSILQAQGDKDAQEAATAAADGLVQAALERGTMDNITVVIMTLQWT